VMDETGRRDDAELVAAVVAGDREAFGPLLEHWPPSMLGLCRLALGPGSQAENVALEGAAPWPCMERSLSQPRGPLRRRQGDEGH
jgi:hypothetical protein